jgi:hypothetical protein
MQGIGVYVYKKEEHKEGRAIFMMASALSGTKEHDDNVIVDARINFDNYVSSGAIQIENVLDSKQGYMAEKYGFSCTDDSINACGVNVIIMFVFIHLGLMSMHNLSSIINYYCGAIAFLCRGSQHRNYDFVCPKFAASEMMKKGLTPEVC